MQHESALRLAKTSENNRIPGDANAIWLGRWVNQMGSHMDLTVSGHDVSGSYTSINSIGEDDDITGALKGYVAGDRISFIVLWQGGSITAWTGQLVNDRDAPTIKTLWHLVTDIPDADEPKKLWMSTLTGADDFTR
jgi:hypothetical protein